MQPIAHSLMDGSEKRSVVASFEYRRTYRIPFRLVTLLLLLVAIITCQVHKLVASEWLRCSSKSKHMMMFE